MIRFRPRFSRPGLVENGADDPSEIVAHACRAFPQIYVKGTQLFLDSGRFEFPVVADCLLAGRHEVRPCLHHRATLLKKVGTMVSRFHLILHGVSE